ncbi:elongation factor Ts [endosymbiont of Pachyrhynchus infernalis]|nr:elongation factor Ts [endosymbiont of Pachyrhynchus infernalis]
MSKDNIELIKKLRKKTGLGLLECKKILHESNFNISLAIKKSFNIKKDKFSKISLSRPSKGKILCGNSKDYKYSILLEINSETDFVSNNEKFNNFCDKIIKYSIENKIENFDNINDKFNLYKLNLVSEFNENISFGKKYIFNNTNFSFSYVHIKKIGVIINFHGNINNLDIIKKISMHIISNKPKYICKNNIPKDIIDNEYYIQNDIFKFKENNNENEKDKYIKNKIEEFIIDNSLLEQKFIFDNNINIKDLLNKYNLKIFNFKIIELKYN